jgi:hypothetical protein
MLGTCEYACTDDTKADCGATLFSRRVEGGPSNVQSCANFSSKCADPISISLFVHMKNTRGCIWNAIMHPICDALLLFGD